MAARRGKPCGASHISKSKVCRVGLATEVNRAINAATGEIGAASLKAAVRKYAGGRGVNRLREIRREIRGEMGGNIVKGPRADELKKRLQNEGLLPPKAKSAAPKIEKDAPKTLSKPDPLYGAWPTNELKKFRAGVDENNPRFEGMRKQIDAELARRGKPAKPSEEVNQSIGTTLGIQSARSFDRDIAMEPLRREGDQSFDRWSETTGTGAKKLGQGGYGTVMKAKDGTYAVKRGDISDTEARIMQKLGDQDLGPKLIAADIDGPGVMLGHGVNINRGRIAMSIVDGKPIGMANADDKIGGERAVDAYWKARAGLHRMGIAHNDMHIDNVLVDKNGKGRFVDLGLAQDNPKAALSEALGAFEPPRGAKVSQPEGVRGGGDWQVKQWDGTGGELLSNLSRGAPGARDALFEKAPVLARVMDNKNALQYRMQKEGYTKNDIATMMNHGLRNDLATYNQGVWKNMTDAQARDYLNALYEGV